MTNDKEWTSVVTPNTGWLNLNFRELWQYRDLIMLFVKRDFVSVYKQTILGPVWFIIQPLITVITFTIIFGEIANVPTPPDIPKPLFYLSGLICWNFFSSCLTKTSNTFIANAGMFGKVYFPRLCVPVSVVLSNVIALGIQFLLYVVLIIYYAITVKTTMHIQYHLLWVFPLLVVLSGILGLGCGIIISSLTTKYRDFSFLVGFGVQLMMYCSTIIFSLSSKYKMLILANPMTPVIEMFRYVFTGTGLHESGPMIYSILFAIVVLLVGMVMFKRVEKSFMDTV